MNNIEDVARLIANYFNTPDEWLKYMQLAGSIISYVNMLRDTYPPPNADILTHRPTVCATAISELRADITILKGEHARHAKRISKIENIFDWGYIIND